MVLKFEDYIKEGLWSKGVDRSKTGEERSENKITSNIDQLKPVDLHDKLKLKFADDILIYGGKELFTEKEMLGIQDGLLEEYNNRPGFNYWYIPHESDIKDMLKIKSIKFSKDENGNLVITNKRTKIEFKTNGKVFWCNSMMGPQAWYYENGVIEICDPVRYMWKEEASILLYR